MASHSDEDDEQTSLIQITENISTRVVQASIDDIVERQLVYVRGRRALITCRDYPLVFWRYIYVDNELEHVHKLREQNVNSDLDSYSHDNRLFSSNFFYYHLQEADTSILLDQGEHHRSYGVKPLIFQIDPNDRLNIDTLDEYMSGDDDEEDEEDEEEMYGKYGGKEDHQEHEEYFDYHQSNIPSSAPSTNITEDPFMMLTRSPNTLNTEISQMKMDSSDLLEHDISTLVGTSPLATTPIMNTAEDAFDVDFDADFAVEFE